MGGPPLSDRYWAAHYDLEIDLPRAYALGLPHLLTAEQLLAIRSVRYPLHASAFAALCGTTPDAIERWTDAGLIPAHLTNGQRQWYYGAAFFGVALAAAAARDAEALPSEPWAEACITDYLQGHVTDLPDDD